MSYNFVGLDNKPKLIFRPILSRLIFSSIISPSCSLASSLASVEKQWHV